MSREPLTECAKCAYFIETNPGSGECHRRPPVIIDAIMARLIAAKDDDDFFFREDVLDATQYPGVGSDWSCGDGVPLPPDPPPPYGGAAEEGDGA